MATAESSRRDLRTASSPPNETLSLESTPAVRSTHSFSKFHVPNEPNSFELHTIVPRNDPGPQEGFMEDDAFLPTSRRASAESVQSYELYTPDEDKKVLKKLDRKLVAFMALLYCLSFLDRSSEFFIPKSCSKVYMNR